MKLRDIEPMTVIWWAFAISISIVLIGGAIRAVITGQGL